MNLSDRLYKIRWLLVIAFVIGAGSMAWSIDTRILFRWSIILGVSVPVGCIAYAFAGAFTQAKWKKWIATVLIIFGGLFWYHLDHRESKVVRMKEDVLYIHPKTDTIRHK